MEPGATLTPSPPATQGRPASTAWSRVAHLALLGLALDTRDLHPAAAFTHLEWRGATLAASGILDDHLRRLVADPAQLTHLDAWASQLVASPGCLWLPHLTVLTPANRQPRWLLDITYVVATFKDVIAK